MHTQGAHYSALVSIALELKNFEHKNRSYVSSVASPNLAVHVYKTNDMRKPGIQEVLMYCEFAAV